ncbi:hypothetical protein ABS735_35175 [Streptomyces sp. MMCC 100]|uniref:hypothetical protein n=1 Tax=Streptomyces sp. MMCC 100 TaxID=3163555 RepID=UPI00359B67B8
MGHSLGGLIAVEYARAAPERARARAAVNLDGFWWGPEQPGAEQVGEGLLTLAGAIAPPGTSTTRAPTPLGSGFPPAVRRPPPARPPVRCPTAGGRRCLNGRRHCRSSTNCAPRLARGHPVAGRDRRPAAAGRPTAAAHARHGVVRRVQRPVRAGGLRRTDRALPRPADDRSQPRRRHSHHALGGPGSGGITDHRVRPSSGVTSITSMSLRSLCRARGAWERLARRERSACGR